MRILYFILYKLVDLFLHKNKHLQFVGPVYDGTPEALELQNFRDGILRESAPYLFTENALALEKSIQLNERSLHFGVKHKGLITCYVRLTPSQFELSNLSHTWGRVTEHYGEFVEFNRLVGNPSIEKRGYFAKLLLLYVGLWLFSKSKYKGIIATCREERLQFLTAFGLSSIYGLNTYLPERKGHYHLLVGTKKAILTEIFKKYLTSNRLFSTEYKRTVS